jgi:hypothetical protein
LAPARKLDVSSATRSRWPATWFPTPFVALHAAFKPWPAQDATDTGIKTLQSRTDTRVESAALAEDALLGIGGIGGEAMAAQLWNVAQPFLPLAWLCSVASLCNGDECEVKRVWLWVAQ